MSGNSSSRQRPLSAEEAELWSMAMRDAKELKRRRRHTDHTPSAASTSTQAGQQVTAAANVQPKSAASVARQTQHTPITPSPAKNVPPLAQFEDRQRRKLARDADLIDARLDLHGMRQREAHGALRGFLFASAMRGHRHVLVITGKGRRVDAMEDRDFFRDEPGVLRRAVPLWLAEPELRSIVISFGVAHIRHGGEGALYIRLRKSPATS